MPAYSSENYSRYWSSSPPISRSNSVSPPLPGSPLSTSPTFVSPISTLKRSTSNLSNSSSASVSSMLSNNSNAPTVIFSPRKQPMNGQNSNEQQYRQLPTEIPAECESKDSSLLYWLIGWYFGFFLDIFRGCYKFVSYVIWAPTLWFSAVIYLVWVILQLPLTLLKWFITILHTSASERSRTKRCVLISGGSTVQAVHLARNFYKAGARVVVCEVEGYFSLARFSTACSKFYTIPKPGADSAVEYVKALKDIVQREKAVYYIPVSSTNTAYYDALAKPHLEIMGCECFVPSASEVTVLDDPLELLRRCRSLALPTPAYFILRSLQDVTRLYEQNTLRTGRYMMLAAGPAGMKDRSKFLLPPTVRELQNQKHEISERRPWVVIRDPGGDHLITCTTIKDSRIVANVCCRVDENRGLIPEVRPEVTQWLEKFFIRPFRTRINGHLSFRLAFSEDGMELVPLGCRVGVSLSYVCHTGIHPRLVWRPCRHFSRQNSSTLVSGNRHVTPDDIHANRTKATTDDSAQQHLLGTVLDKREALFVYWDPLPYCAYYHLQLPFRRIAGAIRAQPTQHNPPLGVVQ